MRNELNFAIFLVFLLISTTLIKCHKNSEFNYELAERALQFAAAAYSPNPAICAEKNNATIIYENKVECDYLKNECWSIIAIDESFIFVGFSGTKSKEQLVTELIESIGKPKHKLSRIGSVHYYFYSALKSMWSPMEHILKRLAKKFENHQIVFTGHSLGGAIASLASTIFVRNLPETSKRTNLITFGQPRVGNFEYAMAHDRLIEAGSWRIIHGIDIVAHIPLCVESVKRPISCIPFYNHGSYHHGIEVWFPMNMSNQDEIQICRGLPINEDNNCSNNRIYYDINDHLFYFGHHVSDYGINGCKDL